MTMQADPSLVTPTAPAVVAAPAPVAANTPAAAPTSPVAAPAVVQAPPAAPAVQTPHAEPPEPTWLKSRLEREYAQGQKEVLGKTGFQTVEEATAAAKLVRQQAEAGKTAEQKAQDAEKALASEKARADGALAFATEHAARMMSALEPAQQEAVKALAGDDPVRQGQTIMRLAPTWAKAEQAVAAAQAAAAPPPTTAPANAAPSGVVPPPANAREQYEQLRQSNPFAAAKFGEQNPSVYQPKP